MFQRFYHRYNGRDSSAFSFVAVLSQFLIWDLIFSLISNCFEQIICWCFFSNKRFLIFLIRKKSNSVLSYYKISLVLRRKAIKRRIKCSVSTVICFRWKSTLVLKLAHHHSEFIILFTSGKWNPDRLTMNYAASLVCLCCLRRITWFLDVWSFLSHH